MDQSGSGSQPDCRSAEARAGAAQCDAEDPAEVRFGQTRSTLFHALKQGTKRMVKETLFGALTSLETIKPAQRSQTNVWTHLQPCSH